MTTPRIAHPDRFKTSRTTLLIDRSMNWFIKIGGIGIIAAVLAIAVFIIAQVIPLFRGASVTAQPGASEIDLRTVFAGEDTPAVLGLDEWAERPFVLTRNGNLVFTPAAGAEKPLPITNGHRVTASVYDIDRQRVALGFADGGVMSFKVVYTPEYPNGKRVVTSKVEKVATFPLAPAGSEIRSIAWCERDVERKVAVIAVPDKGPEVGKPKLLVRLGDGPVEDLTSLVTGVPEQVLADNRGESMIVVSTVGDVSYLHREPGADFRVRQIFRPFADTPEAKIATISFLYGDVSLVMTNAEGVNRQFSLYIKQGDDKRTWGLTKEFERLPAAASVCAMSSRNKAFLVASGAHASLRFGTSATTRWHEELPFIPSHAAINAKYNRIAMLGEDGRLRQFVLDDPHPEAGWNTFFGKVWYEGFAQPKYEWQSTGSDDFEPKLSMVNLMFGTFKATFYALLFAVPIALLGAIYTAEFMHPRFKSVVKPTVEIMAALPSVVLGFLAALWLAPALEQRFPSVLMVLIVVPATACTFGFIWSFFTPAVRSKIPAGWEFLLLIPVLAIVSYIAWNLGPVVERTFFTVTTADGHQIADFRRWWTTTTGLAYEQRNSLIVGVMMGFAVIPIIFTIAEDSLSNVPANLRSASLALGASRWQTAIRIVVPTASAGIFSGLMIGLGRAIGETMIVVMATGNTGIIDGNLFNGMRTLSANIAVELPEAPHGGTLYRSLFLGAVLLFLFTFVINTVAEVMRARLREKYKTV